MDAHVILKGVSESWIIISPLTFTSRSKEASSALKASENVRLSVFVFVSPPASPSNDVSLTDALRVVRSGRRRRERGRE
jgi:hypothetical protein